MLIINSINVVGVIQESAKAAQMMATGAALAETAAQYGLNAALLACPITWDFLGMIYCSPHKYARLFSNISRVLIESIQHVSAFLIPGKEEDTEVFRQRCFDSLSVQVFDGNRVDYLQKVNAFFGVGV